MIYNYIMGFFLHYIINIIESGGIIYLSSIFFRERCQSLIYIFVFLIFFKRKL